MLVTPTPEQLAALSAHSQYPRWREIDNLISAEIAAVTERMIENSEPAVLHECRGRIKALREFQSTARDASKMMEKKGRSAPL